MATYDSDGLVRSANGTVIGEAPLNEPLLSPTDFVAGGLAGVGSSLLRNFMIRQAANLLTKNVPKLGAGVIGTGLAGALIPVDNIIANTLLNSKSNDKPEGLTHYTDRTHPNAVRGRAGMR